MFCLPRKSCHTSDTAHVSPLPVLPKAVGMAGDLGEGLFGACDISVKGRYSCASKGTNDLVKFACVAA